MNYDPNKFDPNSADFPVIPVGKYRIRIDNAEKRKSRNGDDQIKVTFVVSGQVGKLFVYFTDGPYFQCFIDPFYDSFGLKPGDMNVLAWRGKVGAADVKHEMYNGDERAQIGHFILRSRQSDLPAWEEPGAAPQVASLRDEPGMVDVPF
jgi:hypothetical protein